MKFKRSAYENTFNVASQYRKLIEIMRIYTKSFFFYLNMLFTCGCENHTKIKLVNIVKTVFKLYTYTLSMDKRFSTK